MTTLRQIIYDAYREGGITQIGSVPDADQLDEGFRKLNTIIQGLYGFEVGSPFQTISYGKNNINNSYALEENQKPYIDNYYVKPNYRLMCNLNEASTVFLQPNPVDGTRFAVIDISKNFSTNNFAINGNGRNVENTSTVILNTDGENSQWFYRADKGNWEKVSGLTVSSDNPFPEEYDDLLITKLAMRLNPRYLKQTDPETQLQYKENLSKFRAKYKQIEQVSPELAIVYVGQSATNHYSNGYESSLRFSEGLIY